MVRDSDWKRIREVFEQALQESPGQIEAFLSDACGSDETLRARVEELLTAADGDDDYLEPVSALTYVYTSSWATTSTANAEAVSEATLSMAMHSVRRMMSCPFIAMGRRFAREL